MNRTVSQVVVKLSWPEFIQDTALAAAQSLRLMAIVWFACSTSVLNATNYEVAQLHQKATDEGPGSPEQPWKTLTKAASVVRAGDTVLIRDGIYRERVMIAENGKMDAPIQFITAPNAHVIMTGADRLIGWKKVGGPDAIFQVAWPHKFNTWSKTMTHPGDEYHRLIGRCEQVFVDGYPLRQVLGRTELARGTFFVDTTNQLLLICDGGGRDPGKAYVEASVRQEILRVEGACVQVKGLYFRYAANPAQHGAVVLAGDHDQLEDCVIESMNASGAALAAKDLVVRRCIFRDNGQLGFGANKAHRLLFTECLVENNNTKGFDRGWEAGGNKLVLTRDAVLEHSRFVRNRGNGIWFDIGNENCTVRHCYIADNEDSGIFYEISYSLIAQDNVITANGFAENPGAWGAQAGISLSSSPDCIIERNLVIGNREGFNFREQSRSTPRIDQKEAVAVWNHDQTIRNNIIAFNRDAQVWGWFDVKDNRHWPASQTAASGSIETAKKPGDIAESYNERDGRNQPQGLTLEKLRLRFANNIYFAGHGQKWFEWGVTWGQHGSYDNLREFQNDLGIDAGSQCLDPGFWDTRARDYRVTPENMKLLRAAYPHDAVPEVRLGVMP